MTPLGRAGFAALYVFFHHAFVASVIVFIPDYIVYSDNRGLHQHFSLFAALSQPARRPPLLVPLTLAQG
jgi:hypothetical protein